MGWQGGAPRGAAMRRAGGVTDVQRKYEHGLKYDADEKYERNSSDQVSANNGSSYRNMNREGYSNSSDGSQTPQAAIASLDKRISTVQHDLNQALQDVTSKENEKFDLIFSILVELQKRQAQLEESVRTVKAQLSSASGASMEQQPEAVNSPQQGQQQGQQRGQQHTPQQAQQVAGQMGPPMGGYMAGQMSMNQQYVASDGSPTYWAPVVVAMPQNGAQMPYVPQMMPASPMQPMPQQMAMQFVGQGQGGDEYQWGGTAAAESTARSSGSQTAEGAPQEAQPPSSEECKADPPRAEEE